ARTSSRRCSAPHPRVLRYRHYSRNERESSKYFHRLACHRTVWLAATAELVRRRFVDRSEGEPMLNELSKEQLVEIAKRAVQGPQTWRHGSQGPPVVLREITLSSGTANEDCPEFEVKLLPGGKYLFHLHSVLDCWSIPEQRVIWTHKTWIEDFCAQLTDTLDEAVIMLCRTEGGRNHVEIITLDLKNATSQTMVVARVHDGVSSAGRTYAHPQICGDFAAVSLLGDVVLFNWREGTHATVYFAENPPLDLFMNFRRLALIPAHAIVLLPEPDEDKLTLVLIALAALPWTPINSVDVPSVESLVGASNLPAMLTEPMDSTDANPYPAKMALNTVLSADESPIHTGLYKVWIYTNRNPHSGTQYRFDIDVNPHEKRPPRLRHRASTDIGSSIVHLCGSPFSGQLVQWRDPTYQMMPPGVPHDEDSGDARSFEVNGLEGLNLHISPYSGALAYGTLNSLVVQYYQ
ncbi:hypothetical protein C8R46DRAFT_1118731, partial [Mycena filopes]